jgi:outer membrane biosynthesis protein TonB
MTNDQPQQEVEPQPQPQPQPQQEQEPQPQPQPRKKRTTTKLIDHQEPQDVDFNNIGQYVGKKQSKFANECGVITRSMISVEYMSWKKVPIAQKDML